MICHSGRVVGLGDAHAQLEVMPTSACERCLEGKGCGLSLFAGWFGRGAVRIEVPRGEDWAIGDRVDLRLDEGQLARLAYQAYGLPVLAFLAAAGAVAVLPLSSGGWQDLLAGTAGLGALLLTARHRALRVRALPLQCQGKGTP